MQTFYQPDLFFASYCNADLKMPLINNEEKLHVRQRCPGDGANIIDCRHPERELFIKDANGLDLANKKIAVSKPILIKENIPIIPPGCFGIEPGRIKSKIVGIRLYDILSQKPCLKEGYYTVSDNPQLDFRVLGYRVFKGKQIILVCTGIDRLIENLWWRRDQPNLSLFNKIAAAGFYAVTGMNFSSFIGECPLGQLINMNKSTYFCQELAKRGVAVLPHVYAINYNQRHKYILFLNNNPSIKTVALNTQMQKNRYSRNITHLLIKELIDKTSVNILLIGYGISMDLDRTRIFQAKQSDLKTASIIDKYQTHIETLGCGKNSEILIKNKTHNNLKYLTRR